MDLDRKGIEGGEVESGLEDLRGLLAAVRAAGEVGLQVTPLQGSGRNERRSIARQHVRHVRTGLPNAGQVSMRDAAGGRDVPRPDERPNRTAPRVHRKARAQGPHLDV